MQNFAILPAPSKQAFSHNIVTGNNTREILQEERNEVKERISKSAKLPNPPNNSLPTMLSCNPLKTAAGLYQESSCVS